MVKINIILILFAILMGCESPAPQSISMDQSVATRQQDDSAYDPIVARVNGEPIRKSKAAQILWQGRGQKVLNELIALETVQQRARQIPITAWEDLTAQEWDRILQNMAPGKPRREQMALLEYMLQSRGITYAEFDLIVQRQALLRRIVDPNVVIDEKLIAQEFDNQHGRKVEVRVLQVSSLRLIEQAQKRLAAGESFTEVVQMMSEDEASVHRGGLWGPFTGNNEQVPAAWREAAFKLEKIGQRSEIIRYFDKSRDREWWCLMELTRIIPANNVGMSEVKDDLKAILQERLIQIRMQQLQQELQSKAKVEITVPTIR